MADAGVLASGWEGEFFGLAEQVFGDDLALDFPAIREAYPRAGSL